MKLHMTLPMFFHRPSYRGCGCGTGVRGREEGKGQKLRDEGCTRGAWVPIYIYNMQQL
jgi:hypothetical protein